jgi:hypothetical protein
VNSFFLSFFPFFFFKIFFFNNSFFVPMSAATPIHDGMRTPMRNAAWNPYTPMSPPRFVIKLLL